MAYGLKPEIIDSICSIFARHREIEKAIIYGSRARGNYRDASDIDITLIGEKVNLNTLNTVSRELDDLLLPWTFDLSIFKNITNPDFLDHIDKVGKVFYEKD